MSLNASPSVQSPKAYDMANLGGLVLGSRLAGAANATMRGHIRTALQDSAWLHDIHPCETLYGLVVADLVFGFPVGDFYRYGAVGDGVADDLDAITKAFGVGAEIGGGKVRASDGTYGISDGVEFTGSVDFSMSRGAVIVALAGYPNPTNLDDGTWMITATGANNSVFNNVNLNGSAIALGLFIETSSDVHVKGGLIEDMRGSAVWLNYCQDSSVSLVKSNDCGVDALLSGSAYATAIRAQGLDTNNRCENIVFDRNVVRRSGGKSFAMAYCNHSEMVRNFAKSWAESYAGGYYTSTSTGITVRGNIGIQEAGSSGTNCIKFSNDSNQCRLLDNYFEMGTDNDIVHFQNIIDLEIAGNTFRKTVATATGRQHIRCNDDGVNPASSYIDVRNNRFIGHANTNTTAFATPATVANVTVMNNKFRAFAQGLQIVGDNSIVQSNGYDDVVVKEQLAGGASPRADYSSVIVRSTSDDAAVGPGATTLAVTLPAYVMDRTRSIRVRASGTKTGSAANKTISFRFGSTDFVINAAANDVNNWACDVIVSNVSETSQRIAGFGVNGGTVLAVVGTAAENTATALNVGVRADPSGADTITLKSIVVELLP